MLKPDHWSLSNIPPENHPDVGEFFYNLFEIADTEWKRLKIDERCRHNHALYRGKHMEDYKTKAFTPVNLFFSNVERTCASLTAKNPSAEVVDMDGESKEQEKVLTVKCRKWWKETGQRKKLKTSGKTMEIYGYTPEKPIWDPKKKRPDMIPTDPFAVRFAPGKYDDIQTECPYVVFMSLDYVDVIETRFGVKDVASEDSFDLFGADREKSRPPIPKGVHPSSKQRTGNYDDPMLPVGKNIDSEKMKRGIVYELWIRDGRRKTTKSFEPADVEDPVMSEALGREVRTKAPKYRDGIRVVTFCKSVSSSKPGQGPILVLADKTNPNINPKLPDELAKPTYPWGRIPCYKADSYEDTSSMYGFSAAEQTSDLVIKIDKIMSRLYAYIMQILGPMLIVEKNCGITYSMLKNRAYRSRILLMPTKPNADIRWVPPPNLPASFFKIFQLFLSMHDRIYQIEDADRGVAPKGVTAASAFRILQERNAALIQSKIDSVDYLVEQRGKWAIGFWQNFGIKKELIDVDDKPYEFQGFKFAGHKIDYIVESGSTTPKTSLQLEELAKWMWQAKLIDRRTALELLNIPNWKEYVERMGEGMLDQAFSVLIQAGLPKEMALQLKQELMQSQGGPGDASQSGGPGKSGIPGTREGAMAPGNTEPKQEGMG